MAQFDFIDPKLTVEPKEGIPYSVGMSVFKIAVGRPHPTRVLICDAAT
jgi:hypothetical protein